MALALVLAGVAVLVRWRRLEAGTAPSFASAAWPPIESPARWTTPVDGVPPPGYPVKANDDSMIFHLPGGRFYERTRAERCYADAADAIADGYRAAKA